MSFARRFLTTAALALAIAGSAQATAMAATSAPALAKSIQTLAGTASPGTATALRAIPSTDGPKCASGPNKNVNSCFEIVGHSNFVKYMLIDACAMNSPVTIHFEITGPGFKWNSPNFKLTNKSGPNHCRGYKVIVNHNVRPGIYHGITWRYNGGNNYTKIIDISLPVR